MSFYNGIIKFFINSNFLSISIHTTNNNNLTSYNPSNNKKKTPRRQFFFIHFQRISFGLSRQSAFISLQVFRFSRHINFITKKKNWPMKLLQLEFCFHSINFKNSLHTNNPSSEFQNFSKTHLHVIHFTLPNRTLFLVFFARKMTDGWKFII